MASVAISFTNAIKREDNENGRSVDKQKANCFYIVFLNICVYVQGVLITKLEFLGTRAPDEFVVAYENLR